MFSFIICQKKILSTESFRVFGQYAIILNLLFLISAVELGRRYFPHCSDVLDKFLNEESTDLIFLETGTPEDQRVKRMRFSELKEDVRKAFTKDKAAVAAIASSASSSSSPRCEGRGRSNRKLRPSR
jgi:regulatory protein NPR1